MTSDNDVICNMCADTCLKVHFDGLREPYGLIDCTAHGGYLSSNDNSGLDDMTSYTFSLCEKCMQLEYFKRELKRVTEFYARVESK